MNTIFHRRHRAASPARSTKRVVGTVMLAPLLLHAQVIMPTAPAQLPEGGRVVAGQADMARQAGTLTVSQTSARAAIDWTSFSIGQGARVHFDQPAGAVVLNRVTGGEISRIVGTLTATGQVFLTNPAGVYFAPGASVDVGGLVATTHRIGLDDFMAGRARFERGESGGQVVNAGELRAALGGYVALLAPEVRNQGVIVARMGTVALAAGEVFELQFGPGHTLAALRIQPSTVQALVENQGAVLAPGGLIVLSAMAVDRLQGGVVRNTGTLEAQGLARRGGRILLEASHQVENRGVIDASATASGPAGSVRLAAAEVLNSGTVLAEAAAPVPGGEGGVVEVVADRFRQDALGQISVGALEGTAGSITIQAQDAAHLQGRLDATGRSAQGVEVNAAATDESAGGVVVVQSPVLELVAAQVDVSGGEAGRVRLEALTLPRLPLPVPAAPLPSPQPAPADHRLALTGPTVVSGRGRRGAGGDLVLLGDDILLGQGVRVDASGASGGGRVRVGGGWQGGEGLAQSRRVVMQQGAEIEADALVQGQGGSVVLWSDVTDARSMTLVDGSLRARGVAGRGGRIETSGHVLGVQGRVDAGEGGQWLLDPVDLTIESSGVAVGGGTTSPASSVSVNATSIMNALDAGSSVTLLTSGGSGGGGHITVLASIVKTTGAAATLTLIADGDLYVEGGVDLADYGAGLSLVLRASGSIGSVGNIATTGSVLIDAGADVLLYGSIQSTGPVSVLGRGITVSSPGISVTGAGAPLLLQADRSITLSVYQLETNGGDITLWANNAGQGGAIRVGDFTSLLSHGGDITLAGGGAGPDGLPAGYAVGAFHLDSGEDTVGVRLGFSTGDAVGISINSSGGDIVIRGQGGPTGDMNLMAVGVLANSGVSILSGTGTVLIDGVGGTGGGTAAAHGVEFNAYGSATSHVGTTIESANTTVEAIHITGDARPGSQDDRQGIQVSNGSPFRVTASGAGGGITLIGETNSSASWVRGMRLGTATLLARSGPITLVSSGRAMDLDGVILGALPGSSIDTSSADITILTDTLSLVGQFSTLDTTGTLTISPVSASFDSALTWPDAMLHFNRMPGGLELGKPGNLAALHIVSDLLIGGPILLQAGAITLNARVEASPAGDVQIEANGPLVIGPQGSIWTHDSDIDIRAGRLVNQAGASALQPLGSGQWLLWSENPDPFSGDAAVADQRGGLVFDFKQYGFSDASVVLGAGNGLLFSHRPVLGVTLGGVVSKVYDGTVTAALTPANLMVGGGVDGDTVQPSVAANGVYVLPDGSPTKAVGTNQLVQVSGLGLGSVAISSAATGAKPVYGYDVGSGGTVTAAIGVITPKALVVSGVTVADKVYDGGVTATVNTGGQSQSGVVAGDDVTVSMVGQFTDKQAGAGKAVVLSGNVSGLDAGNYSLTMPAGLAATITPKPIPLTGLVVQDRVYDGTAGAALTGTPTVNALAGDQLTVSGSAAGAFADKSAGFGKPVAVSGLTLGGADAGNYSLTMPMGLTATITPRALVLSGVTVADKVYDGGVAAAVSTAGQGPSGVVAGDDVTVGVAGQFTDKQAGAGKAVVLSANVSGADASNYSLTMPTGLTATITPRPIPLTGLAAQDRVYDGTVGATLTGTAVVNGLAGDQLTVSGSAAGAFADKGVGVAKPIAVSGLTLGGADAGNYSVVIPTGLTATITPKALVLSGVTVADKVYDGGVTATVNTGGQSPSVVVVGDDVTVSMVGQFTDKQAGAGKAVVLSGNVSGLDAGNYSLTMPAGLAATITPRPIPLMGLAAQDRVYDGTVGVTLTGTPTVNALAGDQLTVIGSAAGAFADKGAGVAKPIAVSGLTLGGADAGNYSVVIPTGLTATITPKALVLSGVTVADKVYDGGVTAAVSTVGQGPSGVVAGDDVTVGVAGQFADKQAGAGKAVVLSGNVSGLDAGNYSLTMPAGLAATITPRPIPLTGLVAQDRVYDGTAGVTLTGTPTVNALAGDQLTLTGVAAGVLVDRHAGVAKPVAVSGLALGGADAGNYSMVLPTSLTATITPRALVVSGVTVLDKVYDAGVTATVNTAGQRQSGLVAGDDATVGFLTGQFADKQAGAGKAVVLSASTSGADAGNYSVVVPTGLTATVTPRPISLTGLTAQDRVYDGTVGVTLTGTPTVGGLAGDQLSVAGTPVGTFADPAVGASKPVSVAGLVLGGADASNYTLVPSRLLTATVQAVMPPPVVGVASRSEVSPTRTTTQAMLAPAIEVAMEITVGDVSLTGASSSASLGEGEAATKAQEEPTVTAKPAAAAPTPPAVAAAPVPAVTTPPAVTTAPASSPRPVVASPAVTVGVPPGPAGTTSTERSTRTPTGRSPGVAAVPVPMPERPRPAQDTTAAAPSARPIRAPETLSLRDIAGGTQPEQALDRITSAWSAQAIAQGLPAEQVQAATALYGASVTQLMARGVPPDQASAQAAEILAASRPGTPGAPDFSGGSTAGTTLDQLAAKQVAMAVARGVPQAQARATAQTYTRSVAQLMARGVPPPLAVAQASAAMPLSVNPSRGSVAGGSASDLLASSPSDGGRAAVTRLAQAASPQGEQVFGRALGAAVMAGNHLEEAVKVAREAAQEQARLARVDQSVTGALTGAGPRALIDDQPSSVSRGLGNLLASGVTLEKAGQALHELQQVMSGYAKAEARDEAARLAVPSSSTDQPVGSQDALLQKARIVRLQQRSPAGEAPVSPDELARVLAEPQSTALTAVASGRHVAGHFTSPGNSRVFNRVLSAELLKGVAPDQALRTARRAEQDMALRIPLPAQAVTFLARHARSELSVGMENGQPLPTWVQFDRATGSVLLHDVPPDRARVRVVLRAAGEHISLDIGEVRPAPTSPGIASRRP